MMTETALPHHGPKVSPFCASQKPQPPNLQRLHRTLDPQTALDASDMTEEPGRRHRRRHSPRHVTRASDDLVVVDEAAAGQVAGVAGQLPGHSDVPFACLQAVDGADVVQTATGDVAAGRRVGAGHHPAGPQRDGVNLGTSMAAACGRRCNAAPSPQH